MPNFENSSYLSQTRKLRTLANLALTKFPITPKTVHFINHGENATFRVEAKNGKTYLLRIHRQDYHSLEGIQEEISWLALLAKDKNLSVPRPVHARSGKYITTVQNEDFPQGRHCCLFVWMEGSFIEKSLKPEYMYELGQLIAKIQARTPKAKTRERRYWTAEGLVGLHPKFGAITHLPGTTERRQKILNQGRSLLFKKLQAFQKKYPSRQGLIHADLHFGNVLKISNGLGAIDFDDCGWGFHAYDLVIPYMSAEGILGKARNNELPTMKEALFAGYASLAPWDAADEEIFLHLVNARRLLMLGWLNSRSDNPRIKKFFKKVLKNTVLHLGKDYGLGRKASPRP